MNADQGLRDKLLKQVTLFHKSIQIFDDAYSLSKEDRQTHKLQETYVERSYQKAEASGSKQLQKSRSERREICWDTPAGVGR